LPAGAFASSPQELLGAFAGTEAGSNPVMVLLEETRYQFQTAGKYTSRDRKIS
jgi:hypothetical protein